MPISGKPYFYSTWIIFTIFSLPVKFSAYKKLNQKQKSNSLKQNLKNKSTKLLSVQGLCQDHYLVFNLANWLDKDTFKYCGGECSEKCRKRLSQRNINFENFMNESFRNFSMKFKTKHKDCQCYLEYFELSVEWKFK